MNDDLYMKSNTTEWYFAHVDVCPVNSECVVQTRIDNKVEAPQLAHRVNWSALRRRGGSYRVVNHPKEKPMPHTVIVYGPAGCGKTHNKELLREFFGMDTVVDDSKAGKEKDGTYIIRGALHLTHEQPCPSFQVWALSHDVAIFTYVKAMALASNAAAVRARADEEFMQAQAPRVCPGCGVDLNKGKHEALCIYLLAKSAPNVFTTGAASVPRTPPDDVGHFEWHAIEHLSRWHNEHHISDLKMAIAYLSSLLTLEVNKVR